MAIKDIIDKINSDTDLETREIIVKAENEVEGIILGADEEAKGLHERMIEEGREQAEKAKARIITMALLEGKKAVLGEKQKILNEVYAKVEERIRGLDDRGYKSLMKRLIINSCREKEAEVIVGEGDKKRIDRKLVEEVNKTLGKKCDVKLVEEKARIPDGFILRYGKMEVDNSMSSIVSSLKEETIDEVVKKLFK